MKRPDIYDVIPGEGPESGTICIISDQSTYTNNKNLRPITSYYRNRQVSNSLSYRTIDHGYNSWSPWHRNYSINPAFGRYLSVGAGLVANCKSALYDEISGVMLGRDLTHALSGTTAFFRKVPHAAKLLRRGRFREAARHLGFKGKASVIPNTYLGYTYAVSPLVQDVAHLWDFVTQKDPLVFRIVRTKTAPRFNEFETYTLYSVGSPELKADIMRSYNISARIIREYTSECFVPLKGITFNPVPAIWDALPWSFVVDWFLPVSSCLEQLYQVDAKSLNGVNCTRYECVTSITFPNGRISREKTTQPYPAVVEWKYGLSQATSFRFYRDVDTSTKWSTAEALGALRHSGHMGVRRCLNAFALAWQAFSH